MFIKTVVSRNFSTNVFSSLDRLKQTLRAPIKYLKRQTEPSGSLISVSFELQ